jgi:hypothetical protein
MKICLRVKYKLHLGDVLAILETMGIKLYKNCITVVFDPKGDSFEIPTYCIHMPYKYELRDEFVYKEKKVEPQKINVKRSLIY